MNDPRIARVQACLDDAVVALREAAQTARAVNADLPGGHLFALELKMVERDSNLCVGYCNNRLRNIASLSGGDAS